MRMLLPTALMLIALVASQASATTYTFLFPADGTQAGTGSPGTGTITVLLDDITGVVSASGTYSGLLGSRTDQHIHGLAGPGGNAGVIVPLNGTGTTSGTISGGGTLTAPFIAGMIAGQTYFNLHTTSFGGGEIRGQVVQAVPEPTSLTLIGLCSIVALRRRRRK